MKRIEKSIEIQATRETVWGAIISDRKYRLWNDVFHEGSYFEGGWQKGDRIRFLSQNEKGETSGIISEIVASEHLQFISIVHLGLIDKGQEDLTSEKAALWTPGFENYYLEALAENVTCFRVESEVDDSYFEFFQTAWTAALNLLKKVCEENLAPFESITIETTVESPIERVWDYWTEPEHILKWAFASDDWYCPKSINDLRVGGHYATTMASKDGQMAFDFSGTYTEVKPLIRIVNQLDDGRMVWVDFESLGPNQTRVIETFEAENLNSLELQRNGWQAILNNFKLAVETD